MNVNEAFDKFFETCYPFPSSLLVSEKHKNHLYRAFQTGWLEGHKEGRQSGYESGRHDEIAKQGHL